MYALILQSEQHVEVLGFVHYGGALRAVYRDDEGLVSDIDVAGIRMVPKVETHVAVVDPDYPPPDNLWCGACGSWLSSEMGHAHTVTVFS